MRASVNVLLALPFLPPADLYGVSDNLRDRLNEGVQPAWDYLNRTYVNGRRAAGRSARQIPPL